jgi:type II protein arginine methyltransferase
MDERLPWDAFVRRVSENPVALARFAGILCDKGDGARAYELALRALRAKPDDAEVRSLAASVLSRNVPNWHFAIVQDAARNKAYDAALKRAVGPQSKVLEIGTGTGILAMMAARAGAGQVVTCEMVPAIADAAREIVALNGFSDRVRVVAKKSTDIDSEAEIGGRADILVSEIVTNMIVGEDVLPATEHAVRVLLKPGAKIIPARAVVRVALGYDAMIHRQRMGMIEGFDLSPFNRLATHFYQIKRRAERLTLRSAPADLFHFDFQSGGPFPAATAAVRLTTSGGRANGIAQWIALEMDPEGRYENAPGTGEFSAWAVIFRPFAAPRDDPPGTILEVFGSHDRHHMRIWG